MVNDADGNAYPTRAVFDEVRPPELLAWTETHSGLRARIEFVELASDRTEVRIHQTRVPEPMPRARRAGRVSDRARSLRRLPRRLGRDDLTRRPEEKGNRR